VRHPPLIIEIVGVAGTGKSTLYHTLLRRHASQMVGKIRLSRLQYAPLVVGETLPKLWRLVYRSPRGRAARAEQIRKLVYVQVLSQVLERQGSTGMTARILDQGPIHLLTNICELGPLGDLERWWSESLDRWANLLDIVVWLDAPDAVLAERIDSREKQHALKHASFEHAIEFLARSRALHQRTISKLTAGGDATVLCFDTSRDSLDEVVAAVVTALH